MADKVFDRDSIQSPEIQGQMKPYKKKTVTMLMRVDGPFTVKTREGEVHSEDGYLAIDSKGWPYPVAADEFDTIYVPAEESEGSESQKTNNLEEGPMNQQELSVRIKAASLELEGLQKLAEAQRILEGCDNCQGAMEVTAPSITPAQTIATEATLPGPIGINGVTGTPGPVGIVGAPGAEGVPGAPAPEQTITLVMTPQDKLASLEILNKVASELFASNDPEIKKIASEVDKISAEIDKLAYVYESDTVDPELEMHQAFKGGVDKHDKDETFMNEFKTDVHHEVAQAVKDKRVYQPVKDAK